ncbi:MAG: SIS domain-containing protein [Candidatus Heimdallarchaeota archaeon]
MRTFLDKCYKAILDQPAAISRTLAPSNRPDSFNKLENASRIFLTGVGDSYVVSLFGCFIFTELGLNTSVFEAADVNFFPFQKGDALIAVSASGRSTQTLQTVEKAVNAKIETFGLTENPKGALAKIVDHLWLTQAQPCSFNISPSSTTTSAMALLLWAAEELSKLVMQRKPTRTQILLQKADQVLTWAESWGNQTAQELKREEIIFLLGLGPTYVDALLGMMKLHEYAVAKGIPVHMEEFAHHTKLVVNKSDPVILLTLRGSAKTDYFKTIEKGTRDVIRANTLVLQTPSSIVQNNALLETLFLAFPLHFFAYYLAKTHERPILGWREPHVNAFKIYK